MSMKKLALSRSGLAVVALLASAALPSGASDSRTGLQVPSKPGAGGSVEVTRGIDDAAAVLRAEQGTIIADLKFSANPARRDHAILHTDDSRIVLYVDTLYSPGLQRDMLTIAARAVGNRRADDGETSYPTYPEARIFVDNDGALTAVSYGRGLSWVGLRQFPEETWHSVAMTWLGFPRGVVTIYLDGGKVSTHRYDERYDDGRPLFETYAVGFRPAEWLGLLQPGGQWKPKTTMALEAGGISIRDLTILQTALSEEEIGKGFQQHR
jgi:hypothetical protein